MVVEATPATGGATRPTATWRQATPRISGSPHLALSRSSQSRPLGSRTEPRAHRRQMRTQIMTTTAHAAATDHAGHGTATTSSDLAVARPSTAGATGDRQAEYRTLMRKWWFAAAVGAPTMGLSYPWLIPGLAEVFPRGSQQLWWLWGAMGVASLAVLVYSGNQFFTGAWEALRHRQANMHTLIAIGTGTA